MTEPPAILGEAGKARWLEVVAFFHARSKEPNYDLVTSYAACYQRWLAAEEWLANPEHSTVMTVRDDKGNIKSHGPVPQLKIAETASREMTRIGKAPGLNK